jgi:hypothetical protein
LAYTGIVDTRSPGDDNIVIRGSWRIHAQLVS